MLAIGCSLFKNGSLGKVGFAEVTPARIFFKSSFSNCFYLLTWSVFIKTGVKEVISDFFWSFLILCNLSRSVFMCSCNPSFSLHGIGVLEQVSGEKEGCWDREWCFLTTFSKILKSPQFQWGQTNALWAKSYNTINQSGICWKIPTIPGFVFQTQSAV